MGTIETIMNARTVGEIVDAIEASSEYAPKWSPISKHDPHIVALDLDELTDQPATPDSLRPILSAAKTRLYQLWVAQQSE